MTTTTATSTTASTTTTVTCANGLCRRPFAPRATGRPARFCSTSCRQADHRARHAAQDAAGQLDGLRRHLQKARDRALAAIHAVHDAGLTDAGEITRTLMTLRAAVSDLDAAAYSHADAVRTIRRYRNTTVPRPERAAVAAIAECFWCDDDGFLVRDENEEPVRCSHDDPAADGSQRRVP